MFVVCLLAVCSGAPHRSPPAAAAAAAAAAAREPPFGAAVGVGGAGGNGMAPPAGDFDQAVSAAMGGAVASPSAYSSHIRGAAGAAQKKSPYGNKRPKVCGVGGGCG